MNGLRLSTVFAVACICSSFAFGQQQDFSKVQIKVTRVAGNVYMLEGAGGNIAACVGDDGIVIVDDQFAPLADKIRAALKGVSDKPLRYIINTHYHEEHSGGNLPLHDATIVAHDNVRKRLASGGTGGNGASLRFDQAPSPKEALPVVTFANDVTLHVNGEDIRALHVANGHTDGDSVVFFPKANVVHMGDDFVTYGFPFVDIAAGGSVRGMIKAVEGVIAKLPADVKVIPGHGPVSGLADVRSYLAMLKDTVGAVEKGIKAGKSLDQLKQEKVLAPWQKYSGDFVSTDVFIETLYNDLTGKKSDAAPIKHN
jgi:glyoxylase-like metal-dependent hydrolase (beta-lactamase superfamily II)